MTRVKIDNREYELSFDVQALEDIEEVFGGLEEMDAALTGRKQASSMRKLFAIMVNATEKKRAREQHREPAGLTDGSEVLGLTLAEMRDLGAEMRAEIRRSTGRKVESREKDPEGTLPEDDFDGKNGRAGDR